MSERLSEEGKGGHSRLSGRGRDWEWWGKSREGKKKDREKEADGGWWWW